jgi:hypothetical protein
LEGWCLVGEIVFVVIESSEAGESVVGVFSSLQKARAILPSAESGRLYDYRVEYRVLDEPQLEPTAWQVSIRRDGSFERVEPIIACAYCDEQHTVAEASFIEAGGDVMRLGVWAITQGSAIAAARAEAERLIEDGTWDRRPGPQALLPVFAEPVLTAAPH